MGEVELKNKSIFWLELQSRKFKTRPQSFTPKEVADAVGGAYTSLGKVADQIVNELLARGVKVSYLRAGSRRIFKLT